MTTPRHEILFIDANVSDKETIIAGLSFDIETIILDDKNNVLNQIAEALVGYQNLDAIHIISHGAEGELAFANGVVTNSNINSYSAQLKSIGSALSANGDMLLYGCDIAKGDDGLAFINTLADLTGADVAASDDLTGQSGDWVLEVQSGLVESAVVISEEAQAHYADNLDVLTGTVLGDSLTGGYTDDSISGLAGNDTLSGGAGNDTLLGGGDGNDNLGGGVGDDFLDAGSGGYNSLSGQNGNDTLQGGTGYDNISGGDGNDLISADAGNDDIYSGSGNDSISAGTGNDTINGENNDDTIDGGDGDDTISDGSGNDSISGGLGNDIIWIGSGNDTVNGGDGDDIFNVNSSTDTGNTSIDGGTGNDKFTVSIYNGSTRSVKGGAGQDTYKFSIPNTYSGASYVVLDFAAGVGGDYLDITEFLGAYGSGNYYKGGNPFSSSNEFLKLTQSGSDTLLQYDFDGSAGTLYTWKPAITLKNVLVSAITSANILDGTDPTSQTPPTGSVIISGTARQNQTLIATNTIADVNGLGTISYQWLRAGAVISGATQTSYILSQVDVGKSISVIASYTDGQGKLESVSSLASVSVSNVNDLPTGSLTISGTATQGQLLTASNTLADLDGLGTINYQWLSNGSAISGATSSTYTLTQAEVGKTISVKA